MLRSCRCRSARRSPGANCALPAGCPQPAACLGTQSRVWVVVSGYRKNPYQVIPRRQAAALSQRYGPQPELTWHVKGLTVFLPVRA
jgi:hypothetical protein